MAKTTCSVVENGMQCPRIASGLGMCNKHYLRFKRLGSTERPPKGEDVYFGTEQKTCRTCGEAKPRTQFGLNRASGDGLLTHCKPCVTAKHYRVKYDLTMDEFIAVLDLQGGGCGLCSGPPGRKGWCVDHDHVSGVARAVVCERCNLLLAMAEDSIDRLHAALAYLQDPPMNRLRKQQKETT